MKPPEILGMLEEAAGTRMYETKKDAALRTLEKKQVKVQEIEKVRDSRQISSSPNLHATLQQRDWVTGQEHAAFCCSASGLGRQKNILFFHPDMFMQRPWVLPQQFSMACPVPETPEGYGIVRSHCRLRHAWLQVMNEEILPACERLRREKGQYMEWQAANANADRLRRFCVAFRYVEAQRCGGCHRSNKKGMSTHVK